MATYSTYSFTDVDFVISHPSYGQFAANGEGIGEFSVSKTTDRSAHNVAADGSVMTSKIAGNNGTVAISAQQTSELHQWLQGLFNYLWQADTDEWARISVTIRAPKMKKRHLCSNGSFQKEPDTPYQSQGQTVSWNLMFGDIQNLNM